MPSEATQILSAISAGDRSGADRLMERLLLAYVFVCFSVGLVCMGITVVVTHRTRSPVARAFLAFYVALTLLVLASLLLAFLDVVPGTATQETRAVLEYLESIVGFYGVLFTLPSALGGWSHPRVRKSRRHDERKCSKHTRSWID